MVSLNTNPLHKNALGRWCCGQLRLLLRRKRPGPLGGVVDYGSSGLRHIATLSGTARGHLAHLGARVRGPNSWEWAGGRPAVAHVIMAGFSGQNATLPRKTHLENLPHIRR